MDGRELCTVSKPFGLEAANLSLSQGLPLKIFLSL